MAGLIRRDTKVSKALLRRLISTKNRLTSNRKRLMKRMDANRKAIRKARK